MAPKLNHFQHVEMCLRVQIPTTILKSMWVLLFLTTWYYIKPKEIGLKKFIFRNELRCNKFFKRFIFKMFWAQIWIEATCLITPFLLAHLKLQISQWNGFFPSWIESICWFRICLLEKHFPQYWHLNGFSPSWIEERASPSYLFEHNYSHIFHI